MIRIEREVDYGIPEQGTFGTLTFDDFQCYTVERMWADNLPRISCIPTGYYSIERHESPRFGDSAIIYGGTVSKYPNEYFERNLILVHPANRSSDLEGCIGLGDRLGYIGGFRAVLNSRRTVKEFLDLLIPGKVYTLSISYTGD